MASSSWSRETWVTLILVLAAVVLIPTVLFVGFGAGGGMMGGGSGMGAGWIGVVGALVVGGVAVLAYLLLVPGQVQPVIPPPYPHPEWGSPPSSNPAVHVLDERYARGEITREEYMRIRKDLESRTP